MNRHEGLAEYVSQQLARSAWYTGTGLAAAIQDDRVLHPTKPCPVMCDHGARIEPDGQLRTCPTCKGLSYLVMTVKEIRAEYRAIRDRVCAARSISKDDFDLEVATLIEHHKPGYWLLVARTIERKHTQVREARRQETRNRW